MMGNIATSPDMWQALFEQLDSDRIGLCYDPSHLIWQGIDPYENMCVATLISPTWRSTTPI